VDKKPTTGDKWINCNKLLTDKHQLAGSGFDYERGVLGENTKLTYSQAEASPGAY
jgi:hypothetical protein